MRWHGIKFNLFNFVKSLRLVLKLYWICSVFFIRLYDVSSKDLSLV
jgi:hypothetical protein